MKNRMLVSVLCVLPLTGCDGSDPSSPAGPSPSNSTSTSPQQLRTSETADVSGTWIATISASTADIVGGGCLGNVARALRLSRTWTATIEIDQNGRTLPATSVEAGGLTCSLSGSVTGNTVTATVNACTPDTLSIGEVPGCGPAPWHLESLSLAVEATVSGSTITGTPTATGTAASAGSSHAVSATGELGMTR